MVHLRLKGEILSIDGSTTPSIFGWEHRSFFKMGLGFEHDEKKQQYILSEITQLHQALLQTVTYLRDEGIPFDLDESASRFLAQIEAERGDFAQSLRLSKEFLKQPAPSASPLGIKRKLKTYQARGLAHLYCTKNGANFSVPGSGKTTVVYALFQRLLQEGSIEKLIVVGPLSCFRPWEEEAQECFEKNKQIVRIVGTRTQRQSAYLRSNEYDVFLCSYQTATNDEKDIIDICRRFKVLLVVDESHNIKNIEGGKRAEAMLHMSRYAARRVILSGTPIPNSFLDLWTQMTFLWPGEQILGDRSSFRYLCEEDGASRKIKKSVRPFIFRTTKIELRLPTPEFQYVECPLKPYQAQIYRTLSAKFLKELDLEPLDRIKLREWRKAKMVRLIQTASNPGLLVKYSNEFNIPPLTGEGLSVVDLIDKYPLYEVPSKVAVTLDLVRDLLSKNKKVVVWTTFVHNIRMLQEMLQDANPFVVFGEVPKDDNEDDEFNREQQIRYFKQASGGAVLIANPGACAESISLHRECHDAIYVDRTFNCGQYLQSLDRIHRIGLEKNEKVTYHILVATNTIDQTIDRRLEEKETRMMGILEDDLPVGSFEVDETQLGRSDEEEKVDFEATFDDIRQQLNQ